MLVLKKYSRLPRVIKAPVRVFAHAYWGIRYFVDKIFSRKCKQIAICGYPRGGTSLLYNMFSASLRGFFFDEFESLSIRRIHRYGNYVTKSPTDVFNIKELLKLNRYGKEVYVLVVIRDIRDVITSRHPNIPDEYFIGYDNSWWPKGKEALEWGYDGAGVIEISNAIEEGIEVKGVSVIKINYEDIVLNIDSLQRELELDLGITFTSPMSSFYKSQSKLAYKYKETLDEKSRALVLENKPIDTSRIGKWKNEEFRSRICEQFTKCPELFDILIADGYEDDNTWFDSYKPVQ